MTNGLSPGFMPVMPALRSDSVSERLASRQRKRSLPS
jgi:hypothetical protein